MAVTETPASFWGRVKGQGVGYTKNDAGGYDVTCGRCGGTGYTVYHYVYNGECFQCNGGRTSYGTISQERADALWAGQQKAAAKKEAKRLAVCAERDERVAALAAAEPEVHAVLKAEYEAERVTNRFYYELAAQVFNAQGRPLTENQVAAVKRGLAKKAEEVANVVPVVEGRGEVTGEIVSIKWVDGEYGGATKVTVKDDRGFKVYGTLPAALVDAFYEKAGGESWFEVAKGARVQFVAKVEAGREVGFGFFSRPSKGVVL